MGPVLENDQVIRELMLEGMNVARFNFSHGDHAEQKGRLDRLKRIREELNLPVAALLDTKGPEIRIGKFESGKITLNAGQLFTLTTKEVVGNENIVSLSLIHILGCVSYMFDKKGLIIVDKEEYEGDSDDLMMTALDAGAEDFSDEEDSYEITTDPDDFSAVRENLEAAGIPMASAEVTMIPQTWNTLSDEEDIKKINKILDLLDDDDDVQNVYHNWDE